MPITPLKGQKAHERNTMKLQETEAQVIEVVAHSISALYDSIHPYYNQTTSDGVKLDAAWWTTHYPELESKRLVAAMKYRRDNEAGLASGKRDKDREAVKRAVRNNPQAIVEAISELPEEAQRNIMIEVVNVRNAGDDYMPPGRDRDRAAKEAKAAWHDSFEPVRKTLKAIAAIGIADDIRAIADKLRNARPDEDETAEIDQALTELQVARMEMGIRMEEETK